MENVKDTIMLHCSATREGADFCAADIDSWHRQRGFRAIGYHYVVCLDGTIEEGRPYHEEGAHALGWNRRAVGICYIGGLDADGQPADTRTPAQREALKELIAKLIDEHPELTEIIGHRDVANKACPSFDARKEYSPLLANVRKETPHKRGRPLGSTRKNRQYTEWGGLILRRGYTCQDCQHCGHWCPGGSEKTNLALTCRRFYNKMPS